ncbi:MAG: SAM-dependent methyltransferase [Gammaproteobacteria bacterium]|nr:SAM-dependent methyltransferase [Gammaproteobacteria bacterium]|tara:strand:- start:221 stop:841 length:621 start_codon:yes stop_codon:yes gene_type:complete
MNFYDKYILPSLINCGCGTKPMRYQRQKIVPLAEGSVLEIGIGSGLNLPFYDLGKINKIWGLDPSKELNNMAKNISTTIDVEVDFIIGGAEEIPLPDNSIDTVLLTYTLCTIAEVKDSIREMERVLKTSGRMLFCEHGLAPDEKVVRWQERLSPYWKKIAGGCHLNRNIPKIIEDSKFKIVKLESMYLPKTPKFAGFNYWGEARLS